MMRRGRVLVTCPDRTAVERRKYSGPDSALEGARQHAADEASTLSEGRMSRFGHTCPNGLRGGPGISRRARSIVRERRTLAASRPQRGTPTMPSIDRRIASDPGGADRVPAGDRGSGAADAAPEPGAVDPGPGTAGSFPVIVNLRAIGVSFAWWREQALRLEAAGYAGVAAWDHFVSRGVRTDPVLEAWTTLAAVGGASSRLGLMTFVANVMNRHPAVLARMAATLQEATAGRLTLGIGIGGHPGEHHAYGIPFPDAPERVARLEEAVAVLRALWTGGPVTRPSPFYPLVEAHAFPVPHPMPAIIVGGELRPGATLAARAGDGWTTSKLGNRPYFTSSVF